MNLANDQNIISRPVTRVTEAKTGVFDDQIIREIPATIYLNGKEFVTLLCSPGGLKELAVGFLCSEGVLTSRADLRNIFLDEEDQGIIWVETAEKEMYAEKSFLKRYITSCCGRSRSAVYFANDTLTCMQVNTELTLSFREVRDIAHCLEETSLVFRETGGVHNAGLFSSTKLLIFQMDIGRHNALDRIYGRCFLENMLLIDKVLAFSGRISSEIVLKVSKMGVPILISRSAPTDLALRLAEEFGITIAGFVREERMNLYTNEWRIK